MMVLLKLLMNPAVSAQQARMSSMDVLNTIAHVRTPLREMSAATSMAVDCLISLPLAMP